MRKFSETNPANPESPHEPPGPATSMASVVFANGEFRFSVGLNHQCFLCHKILPSVLSPVKQPLLYEMAFQKA